MSLHLDLTKPIKVRGVEVSSIELRDPSAADVLDIGLPTLVISLGDDEVRGVEFRPKVLAKYIARLASIPVDTVKDMALRDMSRCHAFLFNFFDLMGGEK